MRIHIVVEMHCFNNMILSKAKFILLLDWVARQQSKTKAVAQRANAKINIIYNQSTTHGSNRPSIVICNEVNEATKMQKAEKSCHISDMPWHRYTKKQTYQ